MMPKTTPIPADIQKRCDFGFAADTEAVDEQVHDLKGNEAADINNGGMESQVRWLHDTAEMTWGEIRELLGIKEQTNQTKEEEFASFSTVCPYCKKNGQLEVVGFSAVTCIPLSKDGFATTQAEFFETSEEVVHCTACDKKFPLSEVTL